MALANTFQPRWLARHPQITLLFTPTSGSWLNLVEVFFGVLTRRAIRRGIFTPVADFVTAIETYARAGSFRRLRLEG